MPEVYFRCVDIFLWPQPSEWKRGIRNLFNGDTVYCCSKDLLTIGNESWMVFKIPMQAQILMDLMVWSKHWLSNECNVSWGFCLFCFAFLLTHTGKVWSNLQPVQFSGLALIFKLFWNLLLVTGLQMDVVFSDSVCKGEMKQEKIGILQLQLCVSWCALN